MKEIYKSSVLDHAFFDSITVDSSWNFDDRVENKMHRIHAYPAKFPSFITRKAIKDIEKEQRRRIKTVGDVFCGCGTTAYEAMLNGKSFWGCDINPVAVLIAKAKSNVYADAYLSRYFEEIKEIYHSEEKIISDAEAAKLNSRIRYWFTEEQIKNLLTLREAINESMSNKRKYRPFFQVAFSNILKSTSKWLQKSIKPTIDSQKSIKDVWEAFAKQFSMMKKANAQNIGRVIKKNKIEIKKGSVLTIRSKNKIDLLVSSPPYVTSYEYADLHQMSALWLDYTDDYKALRKGTIGSAFHNSDFKRNKKLLISSGESIVNQLHKVDKSRAKDAAKYFIDMQKSIGKCYSLIKEQGQALFVIGNTEYKGVHINNAKYLAESMFQAGFKKIFITKRKISNKLLTPYRTKSGKFATVANSSRKIYAEEFIVKGYK